MQSLPPPILKLELKDVCGAGAPASAPPCPTTPASPPLLALLTLAVSEVEPLIPQGTFQLAIFNHWGGCRGGHGQVSSEGQGAERRCKSLPHHQILEGYACLFSPSSRKPTTHMSKTWKDQCACSHLQPEAVSLKQWAPVSREPRAQGCRTVVRGQSRSRRFL